MRRRTAALGAGLAAAAAITTGGVVLFGRGHASRPTQAAYLAHVSAVCKGFAAELNRIPPPDLGSPASVAAGAGRALPVLRRQAAAVRAIDRPATLERRLDAQFRLTDRSLRDLGVALAAARRGDRSAMGRALAEWIAASEDARTASVKLGIRC